MRHARSLAPVVMILSLLTQGASAQSPSPAPSSSVQSLSPEALDALVAGVAFYSDPTVE